MTAIVAAVALAAPQAAAADLPVLRVDAARAIPNEPKVPARLRMPGFDGRIGIEQRGQSSRRLFPKKSYAIELRRDAPLLGLPADDDWVLYAPYNDKTLMRNVVAYETARAIGRYAARTRFVELRLDGRYHGVYVLMERLELGDDRVAGEALLEFTFPYQAQFKDPSFRTPVKRRPIVWEDPERGDLSRRRANAIARRVRAAERALYGPGSWRRRIDEASAIDFALLNELFKNQDGFHGSTYMALHADGRLRLGPVWDFDIAMGNSDYGPSRRLRGWMLARRDWAERLYRDRAFTRRMARRWRELRRGGLRRDVLAAVDGSRAQLRGDVVANFRRWPVLDRRIWPNPRARGSYRAEVRFLRSWLIRRIRWIDRNIGRL
jgi:CotH kinase protein